MILTIRDKRALNAEPQGAEKQIKEDEMIRVQLVTGTWAILAAIHADCAEIIIGTDQDGQHFLREVGLDEIVYPKMPMKTGEPPVQPPTRR